MNHSTIKAQIYMSAFWYSAESILFNSWSPIDWLIIYGFTSRSRIFHLYGYVTIAGEGLQNLGLCSALRAIEQGGIFIVPHLLWHGTSVFPVSSEGPPHLVASYDTRGCGGSILTRILTGPWSPRKIWGATIVKHSYICFNGGKSENLLKRPLSQHSSNLIAR
jgi:hypothetical protein